MTGERLTPVHPDELEVGVEYQVTGVWRGQIVDLDRIDLDAVQVWISTGPGQTLAGVALSAAAAAEANGRDGVNLVAFERVDLVVPRAVGAVIRCLISSVAGASPVPVVAERRHDGAWMIVGDGQVYSDDRIVRVLKVLDPGGAA
jgi:hypothetical protein